MKNLKAKLRKNGGFTLIEMLIVVAIIAILIAVSIPLVGNALEKARDATDMANERAAKAEGAIRYLEVGGDKLTYVGTGADAKAELYYDAANGTLIDTKADAKDAIKVAYGKCTAKHDSGDYKDGSGDHTESIIKVTIYKESGKIVPEWVLLTTLST